MIRVVNRKDGQHQGVAADIYVGRPSVLGNRFVIGPDGTREEVIQKYTEWLNERVRANDPAVVIELRRIAHATSTGDVNLHCWCAPKACHADVIQRVVQNFLDTGLMVVQP